MKIDHVEPVVPLNKARRDMTWDEVVDRMFNCPDDNLQALCDKCHKIKTQAENKIRREYKKMVKDKEDSKIHLCNRCKNVYPECPAQNLVFGNGKGNDNIISCDSFILQK